MRLILLGRPGAGKGTQARLAGGEPGRPKTATAEVPRAAAAGRGTSR